MTSVAGFLPALGWLPRYDKRWLRADIVGGLSAGAVVVPQAMAYARIADLPPEVGLYTCMLPMLVYAFLGGSRTLSVSTTSTVASLTGTTLIAAGIAAGSTDPAGDLATLTLLVGVILLVARVLRLGGLIDNISEATVTGIKIGVGITVALGQVPKLLGITADPDADNVVEEVSGILDDLDAISWTTAAFSAMTIVLLVGLRRLAPTVPGPLVAVVVGISLVAFAGIDEHGVALISPIPSGLPTPVAPSVDHLEALVPGAFAIAIMCFLETAAVAKTVRRSSEPPIDNDQELAANGLSCVAGALFRAMPSAGGFSQTAINQRAGAVTQVSALVTVTLAVACAMFLGGVLSDLPEATLSSMVIIAVIGLVQPAELVRFWRLSKPEFWVAVLTAVTGLFAGMLVAVLVGVLLTLFLVIWELNNVGVTELQPTIAGTDVRVADEGTRPEPGLLVLRVDGPLYTANVRGVNRKILAAVDQVPTTTTLVLDMSAVAMLTVAVALQSVDLERELSSRGVTVWVAALPPRTLALAREMPSWDMFETPGRVYPTALAATRAFRTGRGN